MANFAHALYWLMVVGLIALAIEWFLTRDTKSADDPPRAWEPGDKFPPT